MTTLEEAEEWFESNDFETAFESYKDVANKAFIMMGVIANAFVPDFDTNDDQGLMFFKHALALDAENIAALLNIVESYGHEPYYHHEQELFSFAYHKLIGPLRGKLS